MTDLLTSGLGAEVSKNTRGTKINISFRFWSLCTTLARMLYLKKEGLYNHPFQDKIEHCYIGPRFTFVQQILMEELILGLTDIDLYIRFTFTCRGSTVSQWNLTTLSKTNLYLQKMKYVVWIDARGRGGNGREDKPCPTIFIVLFEQRPWQGAKSCRMGRNSVWPYLHLYLPGWL